MTATTPLPAPTRIAWIDYAKVLAIFSVTVIHTHCDAQLTATLKGFTIQTFFFLSGYLFSRERNPSYKEFAIKRFRQLVVPYLWINLVAYAAWLTVLRHYGTDADSLTRWHEPLKAMALGLPSGLLHDIPLWSLLCFFVVEMIYYPLSAMIKSDPAIALLFFAIGSAVSMTIGSESIELPLTLGPASTALSLYALGHLTRRYSGTIQSMATWQALIMTAAGAMLLVIATDHNSLVRFFMGDIGNPLWFAVAAAGGISMITGLSVMLGRHPGDNRFIRFMSRSTLIICGFHLLAFAFIKGVALFIFGAEPGALTDGLLPGVTMALTATALCLPIAWFVERYLRFLVSK